MKTVRVKNIEIGEGATKLCVPLTAHGIEELAREARFATSAGADIIEWRTDFFEPFDQPDQILKYLDAGFDAIKKEIGNIPLLFTFRTFEEGGSRRMETEKYYALNHQAIFSGKPDLIDLEYSKDPDEIKSLLSEAHREGIAVILSQHDFVKTTSEEDLLKTFRGMQEFGADISKIAVMPCNCEDVCRLLAAANKMKTEVADRPFIAISMGEEGMISRTFAEMIGSAITYGAGENASAPGQIKAADLKRILTESHEKRIPSRIFLIGFMGSGKSTIGKHLSLLLRREFIDMDTLIEEREGMPISRIFEMESEEYFREVENRILRELSEREDLIIACGGGVVGNTFTGEKNEGLLAEEKMVVFIRDTPETMFGRIAHDKGRPLAASQLRSLEEQFQHLLDLYKERLPHYEKAATVTVDGNGKDPYQIAIEIVKQL